MKKTLSIVMAVVMVLAMAVPAFAVDNVTVNGEVGIQTTSTPGTTNTTYSLTMPTTVNWYVTEHSYPNVYNTNTATNTTDPNVISNTNALGAAYTVSLDSFTATGTDNTTTDPLLTLNLTGDLANDGVGAMDLSAGVATATTYTATLDPVAASAANDWSYGFTGSYTGTLSATSLYPTYTMTIGFAL